jgi:hypothetical protein
VRWIVRLGKSDLLELGVPDVFVEWLRARANDHALRSLDPYADATLERAQLEPVRVDLERIGREWRAELASTLARTRRLPTDPAARAAMIEDWTDRELARAPQAGLLNDATAAVALAHDSGAVLHMRGD